ncbi:12859_t:CDS:2, partial [Gigaspora rosea]
MGRIKKSLLIRCARAKKAREQRKVNNEDNLLVIEDTPEILIEQDSKSLNNEVTENLLNSESDHDEEKCEQNLQETEERVQNLIDTTEMSKTDKGKRCLEDNLLPPSQYEKHLSQSLLHDEDVSLKIANYLRATKFKVNPRLVKQYFENNILSELQIDTIRKLNDEEGETRSIMQLGVNNNGYWDEENYSPNERGLIQQEIEKRGHKNRY